MPEWTFEPGHTAAEFRARHMMVTYVRGSFKNVRGTLSFDPVNPRLSSVKAIIDAAEIWTGEAERDTHLRSPDFLDVERYPQITFEGDQVELVGDHDYVVTGDLAIRGETRVVPLRVKYLGSWQTPWWEEEDGEWEDKGPKLGRLRGGDRGQDDFGVSWNDTIDKGGIIVGSTVHITIDVEAILDDD